MYSNRKWFPVENSSLIEMAKAGRWLAVLRRNYPIEYRKLVPTQSSNVSNDKAQTKKEDRS